jgi:hypothetical protein
MARRNALAELEQRHDKGERGAVLDALDHCFSCRPIKEVPEWAREAFCKGYAEIFNARAKSWDVPFGKPKGHLKQRRRRQELQFLIWKYVRELRATGMGLDDGMFAMVGKKVGVGTRQAKRMYYAIERSSDRWQPRRRRKVSVPQK